jgi:hypothetical protein
MMTRLATAAFVTLVATGAARAEALTPGKPLAALLGEGWGVVATTGNGRPGEVVVVIRKDDKHAACVLSEIRGESYGEAKAKPQALPCLPLN